MITPDQIERYNRLQWLQKIKVITHPEFVCLAREVFGVHNA